MHHPDASSSELLQSPETWIRAAYLARRRRNPAFSMRAFATRIEMSVGQLSEIMAGKRKLTPQMAHRIADRLDLDPADKLTLIEAASRSCPRSQTLTKANAPQFLLIPDDVFAVIADWQHFAILNLLKLKTFIPNLKWIAGRLGISTTEVRDALERLERVGMICKTANGKSWQRTESNFVTSYDVPSVALRRAHRQDLEKSLEALEDVPLQLRDITSITFPADVAKIPEVKKEIQLFQRRIARLMETASASSVYNLNVQLIPITKEKNP